MWSGTPVLPYIKEIASLLEGYGVEPDDWGTSDDLDGRCDGIIRGHMSWQGTTRWRHGLLVGWVSEGPRMGWSWRLPRGKNAHSLPASKWAIPAQVARIINNLVTYGPHNLPKESGEVWKHWALAEEKLTECRREAEERSDRNYARWLASDR